MRATTWFVQLDDRAAAEAFVADDPLSRAGVYEKVDIRRWSNSFLKRAADYRRAFTEIAGLRPVVDTFFTDVFVMADDARVRAARLTLMADLRDLILELADISEIVPQTE